MNYRIEAQTFCCSGQGCITKEMGSKDVVRLKTTALNGKHVAFQGGDVCCTTQPVRTRIPEKRIISLFSGGGLKFDQLLLLVQQKSAGVILLQGFFSRDFYISQTVSYKTLNAK